MPRHRETIGSFNRSVCHNRNCWQSVQPCASVLAIGIYSLTARNSLVRAPTLTCRCLLIFLLIQPRAPADPHVSPASTRDHLSAVSPQHRATSYLARRDLSCRAARSILTLSSVTSTNSCSLPPRRGVLPLNRGNCFIFDRSCPPFQSVRPSKHETSLHCRNHDALHPFRISA